MGTRLAAAHPSIARVTQARVLWEPRGSLMPKGWAVSSERPILIVAETARALDFLQLMP